MLAFDISPYYFTQLGFVVDQEDETGIKLRNDSYTTFIYHTWHRGATTLHRVGQEPVSITNKTQLQKYLDVNTHR